MPSAQQQQSINNLLGIFEKLQARIPSRADDINHLKQFFTSPAFHGLAKAKKTLLKYDEKGYRPVNRNATDIYHKVNDQLTAQSNPAIDELFKILNDPHIEHMISAHDMIAAKEYTPARAAPVVADISTPGSSMKNIEISKGNEPLGATIKVDDKNSSIVIGRVIRGSIIDSAGLVKVGDELHEINDQCVDGLTLDDVADMVADLRGTVKIKLFPGSDPSPERVEIHLRANFSYDHREDKEMPCSDLKMNFLKGDILRVYSKDDEWWQASKLSLNNSNVGAVGLIPGEDLQKRRAVKEITTKSSNGKSKKNKKKKDKVITYEAGQDSGLSIEDIVNYEEVKLMAPMREVLRPLVVVGPPGAGRNELKRVLIAVDPALFCTAIPHTSRPKEPSEVDGKDYYFVSRTVMETQIRRNKFVEYGDFKGYYYGVSIDSIKKEASSGRVCIVDLRGESLKAARISDIKPFIAYIKPPPIERLRETRSTDKSKVDANTRTFTEANFREMIEIGQEYEKLYGHMFDVVIVNDKLQDAVSMLQEAVNNMMHKPQWVPASWVSS